MSLKDSNQPVKFGIQLPAYYERWLRLWAWVKGSSRANLAGNILQSRIEANREQIERDLSAIAVREGVSKDELIKEILNGDSDD